VNQLTIGDAVGARRCADTLNPQATILAFFYAAIAKRITIGAIGPSWRTGRVALGEEKPFVLFRYFLRRARRFVPRFTRAMGLLLLTGRLAMQKRLGSSIVLETKQAAATRENSAAQRVCFGVCHAAK
jgi:hypothetical protein